MCRPVPSRPSVGTLEGETRQEAESGTMGQGRPVVTCPRKRAGAREPGAKRRAHGGASVLLTLGWAGTPASAKVSRCKSETASRVDKPFGYAPISQSLLLNPSTYPEWVVCLLAVPALRRVPFGKRPKRNQKVLPLHGPCAALRVPSLRRCSGGTSRRAVPGPSFLTRLLPRLPLHSVSVRPAGNGAVRQKPDQEQKQKRKQKQKQKQKHPSL
jgi:hypothetical protein